MNRVIGDRPASAGDMADRVQAVAERRDKAAFAVLFDHFAPRLKTYVIRLGASPAIAEELVQDTMLTLWRRADSFDPAQASVSTWIFTIARNKRIDHLRRESRPEFDPEDPCFVGAPEPPADDTVAVSESAELLRAAIAELPAEQAELLQVCYFGDKSHREIAREMNLPLGTVKSRLRLALARLRLMLEDRVR
jgi:RNA polymerase sigma-70 factor (ECF subfamily)